MSDARRRRGVGPLGWGGLVAAVVLLVLWYTSTSIEVTLRNPRSEPVRSVRVWFGSDLVHGPVDVPSSGALTTDVDTEREDVLFVTWTGDDEERRYECPVYIDRGDVGHVSLEFARREGRLDVEFVAESVGPGRLP